MMSVPWPSTPLERFTSASTALLSAGRSGNFPLYSEMTPDTCTWSWRLRPTPWRSATGAMPSFFRALASPMVLLTRKANEVIRVRKSRDWPEFRRPTSKATVERNRPLSANAAFAHRALPALNCVGRQHDEYHH
jgi:hypothetical protein